MGEGAWSAQDRAWGRKESKSVVGGGNRGGVVGGRGHLVLTRYSYPVCRIKTKREPIDATFRVESGETWIFGLF